MHQSFLLALARALTALNAHAKSQPVWLRLPSMYCRTVSTPCFLKLDKWVPNNHRTLMVTVTPSLLPVTRLSYNDHPGGCTLAIVFLLAVLQLDSVIEFTD